MPKDTHHSAATDQALRHLPERVTLAVAELVSAAREGLLALAVERMLAKLSSRRYRVGLEPVGSSVE